MAIAEHHPEEVYARNKGVLQMSGQQLHDFAATKETKLPARKAAAPTKKPPHVAAVSVRVPKKAMHPAVDVIRNH